MYQNLYALEQNSRQEIRNRIAEAKQGQRANLAQSVRRELRRISRLAAKGPSVRATSAA